MNRVFSLVALLIGSALSTSALRADEWKGWLHLTGDDYLAGSLQSDEESDTNVLAWQAPGFAEPFRFQRQRLRSLAFHAEKRPAAAKGSMIITTRDGDRLVGDISDIDSDSIGVRTVAAGELRLKKADLSHIMRLTDRVPAPYAGPITIDRWSSLGEASDWAGLGGRLSTATRGASLFQDKLLYSHSEIELELSWVGSPNFVIAIGVSGNDVATNLETAFRLEVWDKQVVLVRELEEAADVHAVAALDELNGRLRVTMALDRKTGRLSLSRQGATGSDKDSKAMTIQLRDEDDPPALGAGIALINEKGSLRIESLQITPLSPIPERTASDDRNVFQLVDGESLAGELTEMRDSKWVITEDETEHLIEPNKLASASFIGLVEEDEIPNSAEPAGDAPLFRFITRSGSRITGQWLSTESGSIAINWLHSKPPTLIDADEVIRIESQKSARPPKPKSELRRGNLQWADGQLTAWLVPTNASHQPTPVRIGTAESDPVTLAKDFSGQLTYRKPKPKTVVKPLPKAAVPVRVRPAAPPMNLGVRILGGFAKAFGNNQNTQPVARKAMHLKSGEIIPCVVRSIDESGVQFESDLTDQSQIAHRYLRAIRVQSSFDEPVLSDVILNRLMTVPRVGKEHPPTHLIIAKNGDVLRCRLLKMDDQSMTVELRLETIEIERSVVSQVIWLSDTESETDVSNEDELPHAPVFRAILNSGNQISTIPTAVTKNEIVGFHPVLGDTKIRISSADALIIGDYASPYDAQQPFQKWQLTDAPEPLIADSEGGSSGLESPLIGKPAPDFSLEQLNGDTFRVSSNLGKVLVLDFWASWCGPCMQAMPVIDETVKDFDPNQVMLVAVNLQETREPIEKTLDRLAISPIVAMDIDGVAAGRYQADAIPQTVVIDQEGNVARVFVGAAGDLKQSLSDAISKLVNQ